MQTITTIGLDIAKSVFQVHGVDNDGKVVIRRQLKRRYVLAFFEKLQPCLVGIEACASSHHWSREEHCHFEYACCVATDDPLRKITPKNFRALSAEFPEFFARE